MSYTVNKVDGKIMGVIKDSLSYIPNNTANRDYQDFLTWNALQGTPLVLSDDVRTLAQAQAAKINLLYLQANNIVSSRYTPQEQAGFAALYADARFVALTNRAVYIKQLLNWSMTITTTYNSKKADVNALTVVATVDAYVWDSAVLESQNPSITFAGALAILN